MVEWRWGWGRRWCCRCCSCRCDRCDDITTVAVRGWLSRFLQTFTRLQKIVNYFKAAQLDHLSGSHVFNRHHVIKMDILFNRHDKKHKTFYHHFITPNTILLSLSYAHHYHLKNLIGLVLYSCQGSGSWLNSLSRVMEPRASS